VAAGALAGTAPLLTGPWLGFSRKNPYLKGVRPRRHEGITRVEDLPKPRIEHRSRNYPARRCRRCGRRAGRYAVASRTLHDLGDPRQPVPLILLLAAPNITAPTALATSASICPTWPCPNVCTHAASATGVRLVAEDGLPYQAASGIYGVTTASLSLGPPSRTGSRRLGKKR